MRARRFGRLLRTITPSGTATPAWAISAAAPEGGSAEAHDLGGLLGSIDESNRFVNSYAPADHGRG